MWATFPFAAACYVLSAFLAPPMSAHECARLLCLAPAGHICQFEVRTPGGPIEFALPSGERKEVAGVTRAATNIALAIPVP
jgi:hypothetical protein